MYDHTTIGSEWVMSGGGVAYIKYDELPCKIKIIFYIKELIDKFTARVHDLTKILSCKS